MLSSDDRDTEGRGVTEFSDNFIAVLEKFQNLGSPKRATIGQDLGRPLVARGLNVHKSCKIIGRNTGDFDWELWSPVNFFGRHWRQGDQFFPALFIVKFTAFVLKQNKILRDARCCTQNTAICPIWFVSVGPAVSPMMLGGTPHRSFSLLDA